MRSYDTGYSHRKELRWKSVSTNTAGRYVCRANVVKDDSHDEIAWYAEIVEPKLPEVVTSNIGDGKTLKNSMGEPIQMRCEFFGIPRPKITWYRDGNEIMIENNDTRVSLHDNDTIFDIHFLKAEDEGRYKCVAANRIGSVSREAVLKITSKFIGFK